MAGVDLAALAAAGLMAAEAGGATAAGGAALGAGAGAGLGAAGVGATEAGLGAGAAGGLTGAMAGAPEALMPGEMVGALGGAGGAGAAPGAASGSGGFLPSLERANQMANIGNTAMSTMDKLFPEKQSTNIAASPSTQRPRSGLYQPSFVKRNPAGAQGNKLNPTDLTRKLYGGGY